ncbi:hypothetical protein GUH69_04130, partial [Xanthomonas citri pv. citri]|nr:hypothetical protein [Xanthomonas citri pv. citri]
MLGRCCTSATSTSCLLGAGFFLRARIHAERAASPAERALWRSVLDRLSA